LGKSNMEHYDDSEKIKAHAKKIRRLEDRDMEQQFTSAFIATSGHLELIYDETDVNERPKKRPKTGRRNTNLSYMTRDQFDAILKKIQDRKTQYYYFRDYYAFQLLGYLIGIDGMEVGIIKKTAFGKLLNAPAVKSITATLGDGLLTREMLINNLSPGQLCFVLSLDEWGDERRWHSYYHQTSRPGYNLVVQLNFSDQHDKQYRKLITTADDHPFEYDVHPISKDKNRTLAWARIDMAEDMSYVLIEEIQSDWIWLAENRITLAETIMETDDGEVVVGQTEIKRRNIEKEKHEQYLRTVLKPYTSIWEEAMLSSVIWLLKEKLGVNTFYYHTHEGGTLLKGIDFGKKPPTSIYTKLPRKFCFRLTNEPPAFIANRVKELEAKNRVKIKFYKLDFAEFTCIKYNSPP